MGKHHLQDFCQNELEIDIFKHENLKLLSLKVVVAEYRDSFLLALLFLFSSVGVVIFNKWLLSRFGFHFPISLTKLAYLTCFFFMWLLRYFNRKCNLLLPRILTANTVLTQKQIWFKAMPFGVLCGLETVCSVISLELLDISFHTMIRALVPGGVLMISFLMGFRSFRWSLAGVVFVICTGVVLMSVGEEQDAEEATQRRQRASFSVLGVVLALASVAFNSAEWVFSETLLKELDLGSADLLFYGTPFAGIILVPIFFSTELLPLVDFVQENAENGLALEAVVYFLVVGSFFLMFMFVAEFVFVKFASALSLSICHSVKELFLTLFGVVAWRDPFGKLDIFGFSIAMIGVVLYNFIIYFDDKRNVVPPTQYHQIPTSEMEDDNEEGIPKKESQRSRKDIGSNNNMHVNIRASVDVDDGVSLPGVLKTEVSSHDGFSLEIQLSPEVSEKLI